MAESTSGILRVNVDAANEKAEKLVRGLLAQYEFPGALAIVLAATRHLFHVLLHTQTPFFETNIITLNSICRDLLTFVKQHESCCQHLNGQHKDIPKEKMS